MIAALAATAHVVASCTGFMVRTAIEPNCTPRLRGVRAAP
jgi:hypothetical protein